MSRLPKWRLTQTAMLRILMAIILVVVYAYSSRAQEASDSLEPITSDTVQAVLESINGRNPETPADFVRAVSILRKLGAYAEAQTFLDKALAANMDAEAMVEFHREIGTAELVVLSTDTNLPAAREFVFSVFDAVKKTKRSTATLQKYINGLADADEESRRVALLRLSEVGAHAVPALVENIRKPNSKVRLDQVESALVRLGDKAEEPLIALLGSPDPTLQGIATRALGRLKSKRARLHLIRPYFVGQQGVQQSAAAAFRLAKTHPNSVAGSAELLAERAKYYLAGNPPVRADFDGNIDMWVWSAEQNNVVSLTFGVRQAAAVTASRFAKDAYEISPSSQNAVLLLVCQLHSEQLLGGIDKTLVRGSGSAFEFGQQQGLGKVFQALDFSLTHEHDAAAIGALELLGELNQQGMAAGMQWTPLTRALQHPNRRVRYAATKAIMTIDPRHQYTGASFLMESLIDLAQAAGQQRAAIGMPRRNASDSIVGGLGALGFSVATANEGKPLLKAATKSSDLDVIFLSDSTSRPLASEVIQQLRKHPFTKRTPIVLMVRRDGRQRAERIAAIDELTTLLPEFADDEALTAKLEEVEKSVRDYSVSPTRRLEHAKDALIWLTHLAEYSQTYKWYDLQRANEVALAASNHPALRSQSVPLLGYLGNDLAQQRLVDLASLESLAVDDRQRAANGFTEAVVRRGLMLRSRAVKQQYARYNASEKEEVAIQEILGQVLDAIESQTKPTSVKALPF